MLQSEGVQQVELMLEKAAPEILPPKRLEIAQLITMVAMQQFSGPLPPPHILAEYDKVLPGAAATILARAEKQSDHRMKLEKTVIPAQQRESARGQIFGLIVAITGILIGGACILTGHDVAGATVIGIDLLGMVTVFVTGKAAMALELMKKRKGDANEAEDDEEPPSALPPAAAS